MSKGIKFAALAFSEGLNVLAGFLFLPYLARAMSKTDYGTYGQVLMIVGFVQGFFILGLDKVIFHFFSKDNQKQNYIFYSSLMGSILTGLLGYLLIVLGASSISSHFSNDSIIPLLIIYGLSILFMNAGRVANSTLIFFDKIKETAYISVITNLLRIVLVVIAVQIYHSLLLVFIFLLFVELLRFILLYSQVPVNIRNPFLWDFSMLRRLVKSGWSLGVAAILGVAFWSTDGYMISSMMDVESFADYRNGAFQIPFIASIYGAVSAILLPDVSKYFIRKKYDDIVRLKKRVIQNTGMLIFPVIIFCIVFAKPLIVLYLSEKYIASYPVFMVYNMMLLSRFTSYDDLFIASNNTHKMPLIYLISLVVNIVLNYYLISYYGIIGAAVASVISYYLLIFLLFNKGAKFVDKSIGAFIDWSLLFKGLGISFLVAIIFYFGSWYIKLNYWTFVLMALLYSILVYHWMLKYKLIDPLIVMSIIEKMDKTGKMKHAFSRLYIIRK